MRLVAARWRPRVHRDGLRAAVDSVAVAVIEEETGPDGRAPLVEYVPDFVPLPHRRRLMSRLLPPKMQPVGSPEPSANLENEGEAAAGLNAEQEDQQEEEEQQRAVVWEQDSLQPYASQARPIVPRRRVCAFGDIGTRYRYTNVAREGKGWPSFLIDLKAMVELRAQQHFNFVFCNLYANEHDYIGWHQDKEEDIVKHSTIAAVSLGAARRFCLRHDKTKHIHQVCLEDGSLLLMRGDTQERYRHSLPRAQDPCGVRISLTFRLLHTHSSVE